MYARQDNIRHSSYSEMDLNARLNANVNRGKNGQIGRQTDDQKTERLLNPL